MFLCTAGIPCDIQYISTRFAEVVDHVRGAGGYVSYRMRDGVEFDDGSQQRTVMCTEWETFHTGVRFERKQSILTKITALVTVYDVIDSVFRTSL